MEDAELFLKTVVGHINLWLKGGPPSYGRLLAARHFRLLKRLPRTAEIGRIDQVLGRMMSVYGLSATAWDRIECATIELLTNSFQHAGTVGRTIGLDCYLFGGRQVIICVRDHQAVFDPKALPTEMPDWQAVHGRGFPLVLALADDVGCSADGSICLIGFRPRE